MAKLRDSSDRSRQVRRPWCSRTDALLMLLSNRLKTLNLGAEVTFFFIWGRQFLNQGKALHPQKAEGLCTEEEKVFDMYIANFYFYVRILQQM